MFKDNRLLILYSILFYCFFVVIRLFGVIEFDIQPDEVHWLERSSRVLDLFKKGYFSTLTTHLGQPGIVPTLIMALGQGVFKCIYRLFDIHQGDFLYLHPFFQCRIACILASSLVVFPLILLGSAIFDFRIVALACSFLALSPHHIGFSRLAHLDATMTSVVVTAFLFYLYAIKTDEQKYKLIAGFFWGLSIATKPTALSLIFSFFIIGAINSIFIKKEGLKKVISIYDFWAVFIGHFVFACLYTRIWVHESEYLVRLNVQNAFADMEYFLGTFHPKMGALLCSASILYCIYRFVRTEIRAYLFLIFFFSINLANFLFPAVCEGIIRFWSWTFGLSKTAHIAYGKTYEGASGGYIALIMHETSLVILSLILLDVLFLTYSLVRGPLQSKDRKKLYLFIISIVWVGILSVSSKQTIRYILPIFPCMYLLASDFVWKVFDLLPSRVAKFKHAGIIFCLLFLVPQSVAVSSIHPNQIAYSNALGGTSGIGNKGEAHYFIGINKVVKFLRKEAKKSLRDSQLVYVGGDLGILRLAHLILHHGESGTKFMAPVQLMWGSYFVRFHHLDEIFFEETPSGIEVSNPVYEVKVGSNVLMSVYKINTPSLENSFEIDNTKLHRRTGRQIRPDNKYFADSMAVESIPDKVYELVTGREAKSYAFFSSAIELDEGVYDLGFYTRLISEEQVRTPVFEIQMGKCKHVVYSDELAVDSFKLANSACGLDEKTFVSFKVYWFGKISVEIGNGKLRKVS